MNIIKQQSNSLNVGSNSNWPRNYITMNSASYDVYRVNESEKHYLWCTGQSESTLEKLAVGFAFIAAVVVLCFSVLVVF